MINGPYNQLTNVAGLTLSDSNPASGSDTSVSGVTIRGEVPWGTDIPGVGLSGDHTVPSGSSSFNYLQKMVSQSFGSPAFMAMVLNFTLAGRGSANFSGTLELTNNTGEVPEPATLDTGLPGWPWAHWAGGAIARSLIRIRLLDSF